VGRFGFHATPRSNGRPRRDSFPCEDRGDGGTIVCHRDADISSRSALNRDAERVAKVDALAGGKKAKTRNSARLLDISICGISEEIGFI